MYTFIKIVGIGCEWGSEWVTISESLGLFVGNELTMKE